jgi:hypothetical protein
MFGERFIVKTAGERVMRLMHDALNYKIISRT